MKALITRLERLTRWLGRVLYKITPTSIHVCAFHGGMAIRTFKQTGKACIYCQPDL